MLSTNSNFVNVIEKAITIKLNEGSIKLAEEIIKYGHLHTWTPFDLAAANKFNIKSLQKIRDYYKNKELNLIGI